MIETVIRRTIDGKWHYTQSGAAALQLQNGLQKLPSLFGVNEIDDERIVDYIVYQIYRNRNLIENGRWSTSWLFSCGALEKYHKQFMSANGKSGINYYINQWLAGYELSRATLASMIAKPRQNPLKDMIYMESEEVIKRRFLNTDAGLALCQRSTTGWSPHSEACKQCNSWIECGKITAKKYPELMRFRKEEYGKQKK